MKCSPAAGSDNSMPEGRYCSPIRPVGQVERCQRLDVCERLVWPSVYQILILVWWINRIKINYPACKWPDQCWNTGRPEIPLSRSETPSEMTELASGAITAVDTVTIELGEAVETPAIVIVRWPAKATVFHPAASVWRGYCCRVFAAAVVKLAQLRRD